MEYAKKSGKSKKLSKLGNQKAKNWLSPKNC